MEGRGRGSEKGEEEGVKGRGTGVEGLGLYLGKEVGGSQENTGYCQHEVNGVEVDGRVFWKKKPQYVHITIPVWSGT